MARRFGIVVEAHPEDNSVDVIMSDDYSRLAGLQVMSPYAGSATGLADLHCPEVKTGDDKWMMSRRDGTDTIAVIDFDAPMPYVCGFLFNQIGQMTFADKNRRVQRHASDVYSTLDALGNFEMAFPNGTFMRVGTSEAHEDLTGKDFDKKWAIKKNKTAATHLRVVLANNGVVKADLHIDPAGNVTGSFQGTGDLTFAGALTVTAPTATVNASTSVTLNTPTTHMTGNATIDGNLAVGGTAAVTGATTLAGVTSNGKNISDSHKHKDTKPSTGETSGTVQ